MVTSWIFRQKSKALFAFDELNFLSKICSSNEIYLTSGRTKEVLLFQDDCFHRLQGRQGNAVHCSYAHDYPVPSRNLKIWKFPKSTGLMPLNFLTSKWLTVHSSQSLWLCIFKPPSRPTSHTSRWKKMKEALAIEKKWSRRCRLLEQEKWQFKYKILRNLVNKHHDSLKP